MDVNTFLLDYFFVFLKYRTHAHSCVVKGRATAFQLMTDEFKEVVDESDKGMDHLLEELKRKEQSWDEQVVKIVKTYLK